MSALAIESNADETASSYRLALTGDALADAARLIAINGLLGESPARRGDKAEVFAQLKAVADPLDEAREIVKLAGGLTP